MDFTRFTELIRTKVAEKAGSCCTVRLNDIRKNNGIVLKGLTIMHDDSNVSPTIYLNHYFENYTGGRTTLTDIVTDVMDTYHKNNLNRNVDVKNFLNYESIRPHVVYKLINTERNKELLGDVPHMDFLDLSVVFQCLISQEDLGTASILIHNVHLKLWDVSAEMLYQAAKENTPRLKKHEIRSMTDVLCEIIDSGESEPDECMSELSDSVPMYVLSNKYKVEGASCMLYPDLLNNFANVVGSSFFIIPSSIHELLLLPAEHTDMSEEIKKMIRAVNDTQVSAEEILSYSLYLYDKDEGKIIIL